MQDWCTIESDPGVFTELIRSIGVKNIQVEEIYDLNDSNLIEKLQPIYGLVFLFRWTSKGEKRDCLKVYDSDLFFANQVIQNACATQAIVSVLLNNNDIQVGDELKNYKDFAMGLDSKDRGLCLGNSEVIRTAHNSFARQEPFVFSGKKKAKEGDDVFHFIAYIPFKGRVYELDGLQEGPILIGQIPHGIGWVEVAKEAIMKRIAIYQESEINFTLLAINKCKKAMAIQSIQEAQNQLLSLYSNMIKKNVPLSPAQLEEFQKLKQLNLIQIEDDIPLESIQQSLIEQNEIIQHMQAVIAEQDQKFEQYKVENARRKHNYIPLILELLKMTAKKGKLDSLVEEARQKQQQKKQNVQQQQKK